MENLLILILSLITLISSFLALEIKNMTRSVIFLWISAVSTGLIFFSFDAWYSAIFQWVVYGGILAILFLTFVALLEKNDEEEQKELSQSITYSEISGE